MLSPFKPAWWLPGPHLQTLWSPVFRRAPALARERTRLWLADDDFIDLDWHLTRPEPQTPLVLIAHGLTGSSGSVYVLGLQQQLAGIGWNSVALNWRGCSGEPNRLPRGYHSGVSDDLAVVIAHLQRQCPQAPLYAVGYSLGGNVLLKYLGETGPDCPLQGAVAVSVPYRLDQCAERIDQGFSRFYQSQLMRELQVYLNDKRRHFTQLGLTERLAALERLGSLRDMRTFWDFDGRVTAPLHGFSDARDYYRQASSSYYLSAIRVPTLLIQAADDPFVFRRSLPETHELPASTEWELHENGGHVGFVYGPLSRPRYYLEERIPRWLLSRFCSCPDRLPDRRRPE